MFLVKVEFRWLMFCGLSMIYYLCDDERKDSKSIWQHHTDVDIYYAYSLFDSLYLIPPAVQDYPKTLSQMNLAGKSRAACKYLLRVCGSLYIR